VEAKLLEDCLPEGGDGVSFVVVGGAVLGHLVAEMVGRDQISSCLPKILCVFLCI
jgi:hypothetical protein